MLRITEVETGSRDAVLLLEGKVAGEWADELSRVCENLLNENRRLTLDFTHVTFVDSAGTKILKNLLARKVKIVNCSAFLRELLSGKCDEGANKI